MEEAKTASKSIAAATVQVDMQCLKAQADEALGIFEKTPDPEKNEKKFLTYLAKHGSRMNAASKELELMLSKMQGQAKACGLEWSSVDAENKTTDMVRQLNHNILNIISINTLITLLRSPKIRVDVSMQALLKTVYDQFETTPDLGLQQKFQDEVKLVLNLPDVAGSAVAVASSSTSVPEGARPAKRRRNA